MNENPAALLPELILLGGAVLGLLTGLFLPRARQWVVSVIAAVALVAGITAAIAAATGPAEIAFDTYAIDLGTHATRIMVMAAMLLVLGISRDTIRGHPRETEFVTLLLLAALGTVLLGGVSDLLVLVAAYLLASIPAYALTGFGKDAPGTEAALKYYLMGAFLGVAMLAGVTILYGATGATGYGSLREAVGGAPFGAVAVGIVVLLAGLAFKIGAVPGHFWVPDVAEGASAPIAAFVTTVPKIGGMVAVYRLFDQALEPADVRWRLLIALLATASMTLGNLAAFFQDNPRRLLGYSTISQVGYVLLAVVAAGRDDAFGLAALLFYLAGYAITNLGAFAVVAEFPKATTLSAYAGLFHRNRGLALSLIVCLLGLVGTPPTAVFVGKVSVFTAATDAGFAWLMVVAAINTVVSLFYYLRWVVPLFAREVPASGQGTSSQGAALEPAGSWSRSVAYGCAVAAVVLGIVAGPALDGLSGMLVR